MVAGIVTINASNATALRSLLLKQIRSIGVPIWGDPEVQQDFRTIYAYCFCTEAGGDIASCRRIMQAEIGDHPNNLLDLDIDCLQHQDSLGTLKVLPSRNFVLDLLDDIMRPRKKTHSQLHGHTHQGNACVARAHRS